MYIVKINFYLWIISKYIDPNLWLNPVCQDWMNKLVRKHSNLAPSADYTIPPHETGATLLLKPYDQWVEEYGYYFGMIAALDLENLRTSYTNPLEYPNSYLMLLRSGNYFRKKKYTFFS